MLERGKSDRGIMEMVDLKGLAPPEHLLRKIDAVASVHALYKIVEALYSEDQGRPSVDPVVLFKMVLVEHLYGLAPLRRTADEASLNGVYRWFLQKPNVLPVGSWQAVLHQKMYRNYLGILTSMPHPIYMPMPVANQKSLQCWVNVLSLTQSTMREKLRNIKVN